ncbi:MAG: siphovirus Gp157 family protein [Ignavibacteria bacterium]|mgnify:CR=1 FL=1|nr:siphovirus Gp157 family protein [Ignavibacteria bacterium]
MKLYEINDAYYKWLEKAQENEGELTQEMLIEYESIDGEFEKKAEAYAILIKTLNAEAELIKAEKQRLDERQKQKERLAESLKERLTQSMQLFEKDKFETPKCKVSFRTSKAVEVDESKLPKAYFKITRTPLKADIKLAIESGKKVRGAAIVERKNIQIK